MDILKYDSSDVKGCWTKNKKKIDDPISTRVPVNMDRTMCKTRINNSIEKRKSTIENIYNCGNDHQCDANTQQINALDYPRTPATTPVDGIIVIRAIELLLEDAASSLNNTLAEQGFEQREEKRKHHDSILQTPDVSIIQYRESPELPQDTSVENPNLSKVTEMGGGRMSEQESMSLTDQVWTQTLVRKNTISKHTTNKVERSSHRKRRTHKRSMVRDLSQ